MAGCDDRRPEGLSLGQRLDPRTAVAVPHEVERSVHGSIAGKEDALLREPGKAVPVRVADAEVPQFHAVCAIVEDHDVAIEQRGWRQACRSQILTLLRRVLPPSGPSAEQPGFILAHLGVDVLVGHRSGTVLYPDLIAVGVVAVMVGIEREPDRLAGLRLDLGNDFTCTRWKIGVEHQHVVVEHDPAVVAVALAVEVALVEKHARCELLDDVHLAGRMALIEREGQDERQGHVRCEPLHGASSVPSSYPLMPYRQAWRTPYA